MFYGPFPDIPSFTKHLVTLVSSNDTIFYTVLDRTTGLPRGVVSYLRMEPSYGVIEIGHIWFAPELQRTRAATEAIYLLARHVFDDLGYRRLEWKCDSQNARSRSAALRFGFRFEGVFRNHLIVKGRNRDTAWFGMTDGDWPGIKAAFEAWLSEDNFDSSGAQRRTLAELRREVFSDFTIPAGQTLLIRDATEADEHSWGDMWAQYNRFYQVDIPEEAASETWRKILDPAEPFGCLLAVVADRPIGLANFVLQPHTWSTRPRCLLEDLYVSEESRSQGVGRALIEELVARAKSSGWTKVFWLTHDTNARARRLYDSITPPDGCIQYSVDVK